MKISIIIPVYNAEKYVEECFRSIINQSYKDYEIIFINDSSTDNSLSIIKKLVILHKGIQIKIISNKQNKGTAFSRNKGITQAIGEYIYFMDDDDTISVEALNTFIDAANKYNYPDIVCANVNVNLYKRIIKEKYLTGNINIRKSYFNSEWYEMPWNKLIKRSFLLENKLFFTEDIYYEDTLWSYQTALKAQSLLLLPNNTYFFRISETQNT